MEARTESYVILFFLFCLSQWNNLDSRIRDLSPIFSFNRAILELLRPKPSPTLKVANYYDLFLLTSISIPFLV